MPDFNLQKIIMMVIPVILALTVHEFAHALAAHRLGDNTARNEGRLTMNPLAHLDPIGTVMLFFSGLFGWAKPVPFNPGNFKNPVRDTTLVALAGPASNFLTAIALFALFKLCLFVGVFRWLPVSPETLVNIISIFTMSIMVNISIAIFNLLPIPPLDGFKVISYFLPHRWVVAAYQNQTILMVIMLVLILTGAMSKIILPVISLVYYLLMG